MKKLYGALRYFLPYFSLLGLLSVFLIVLSAIFDFRPLRLLNFSTQNGKDWVVMDVGWLLLSPILLFVYLKDSKLEFMRGELSLGRIGSFLYKLSITSLTLFAIVLFVLSERSQGESAEGYGLLGILILSLIPVLLLLKNLTKKISYVSFGNSFFPQIVGSIIFFTLLGIRILILY